MVKIQVCQYGTIGGLMINGIDQQKIFKKQKVKLIHFLDVNDKLYVII